jgi:hypothetical protein
MRGYFKNLFILLLLVQCGILDNGVEHVNEDFVLTFEKNGKEEIFYSSVDLFSSDKIKQIGEIKRIEIESIAFENEVSINSAELDVVNGEESLRIACYKEKSFSLSEADLFPFLKEGRYLTLSLSLDGDENIEKIDLKISFLITGTRAKND